MCPVEHHYIREQDPLKQGLKRFQSRKFDLNFIIREQDPLKQGLKPPGVGVITGLLPNSRARSTKTRIETISVDWNDTICDFIREQDPLKQGLKRL